MLKVIIAPLLGGIIGYITNDLAIKMLFRPRKSVYIGKFHVPFTPGLIPQQKSRIAKSIGRVVSGQLLNADTLKQTILSKETVGRLQDRLKDFFHSLSDEKRTVAEILELHFSQEQIREQTEKIERKAAETISSRIVEADIGGIVVDIGMDVLMENEAANLLKVFLLDSSMKEIARQKLSGKINRIVEEKAPDIIYDEIENTKINIMEIQICELYSRYQDKEDLIVGYIMNLYVSLLGDNFEKLLEAVNVEQIVVDKINSFDAAQLEDMIFGIMKRELKAIVYLGALLGSLMGFINLLF